MKTKIYLIILMFLMTGCARQSEIVYYMPKMSAEQTKITPSSHRIESVGYLASDKIWYEKEGVFLPYKHSFLAKTPREHIGYAVAMTGVSKNLNIKIIDSYQLYSKDKISYILTTTVSDGDKERVFALKKEGYGEGPSEAVRGFGESVDELCRLIKEEFGGQDR